MATLYKRGDTYWVRFSQNGKQIRESLGVTNKKLAERKLADIQIRLDRGVLALPKKVNAAEAWEFFDNSVIENASAPKTRLFIRGCLKSFKAWLEEKNHDVLRLGPEEIEAFLKLRRIQVSSKTVKEELAIIRRFYRFCVSRQYLGKDPTECVESVKVDPKRIRIFTPEELSLIWKHARPNQYSYYKFLLMTGLRDGECRELEWADIDFQNRCLYVRIKDAWVPKTRKGRTVHLPQPAIELLQTLPRRGSFVFATEKGEKRRAGTNLWDKLCQRIKKVEGVDLKTKVSLHTFRHTYATECLMQGIDLKTVSELLGHSSVKMTEKYLHLLPAHKQRELDRVDFSRLLSAA